MTPKHLIKACARGVLVITLFWLTAFALVQFGQRVVGGWAFSQAGEVLACAVGILLAFRMRVKPIAYFLAGQLAFALSELVLHGIYGNRAVQGGPTHFAVMLAGTIGVALGWFLRTPMGTSQGRQSLREVASPSLPPEVGSSTLASSAG